jgi:hypothetical protein
MSGNASVAVITEQNCRNRRRETPRLRSEEYTVASSTSGLARNLLVGIIVHSWIELLHGLY